jgi:NhaP-type Na+/H+ or K+/H+ antiporter
LSVKKILYIYIYIYICIILELHIHAPSIYKHPSSVPDQEHVISPNLRLRFIYDYLCFWLCSLEIDVINWEQIGVPMDRLWPMLGLSLALLGARWSGTLKGEQTKRHMDLRRWQLGLIWIGFGLRKLLAAFLTL